jgi:quercetin dioxygenase-like cupin family protein
MSKERNSVLDSVLGQAKPLAGLIEYAADSVVSKTLLDKPVGTITLFAFDQGQSLSEHTAPYHATVQVVDGKGMFTIGGKENEVKAGEVLIMPANVPHAVYASERFKMLLIMIRA